MDTVRASTMLFIHAAADVSWFLDEGVIDKKTWLAFLDQLEHKSG